MKTDIRITGNACAYNRFHILVKLIKHNYVFFLTLSAHFWIKKCVRFYGRIIKILLFYFVFYYTL